MGHTSDVAHSTAGRAGELSEELRAGTAYGSAGEHALEDLRDTVVSHGGRAVRHCGQHLRVRVAIAYAVPAQDSIARSFGMSPNASTSSAPIPRSSHSMASVVAFVTPTALISTSPLALECVSSARSPTTSRARASSVSASLAWSRTSSLAAGAAQRAARSAAARTPIWSTSHSTG